MLSAIKTWFSTNCLLVTSVCIRESDIFDQVIINCNHVLPSGGYNTYVAQPAKTETKTKSLLG